jgi:hypothetical protein
MRSRVPFVVSLLAVTFVIAGHFWLKAQSPPAALAAWFPPDAQIYLEAPDFQKLVKQWNASSERAQWLKSNNFGVLSRSRLMQRLGEAQDQFATVAGIPVAYNLLNEVAGTESAFAFYNLSDLKFVYVTRMGSARLETNPLWKKRSQYELRRAAGITFYLRTNAETRRSVAFAAYKDWLIVASAEVQMEQTLALLSGAAEPSLAKQNWFSEIAREGAQSSELKLVYNLDTLLPTAQFRTYWVQRNNSELKPFRSGVADLSETSKGFEEKRVLLRRDSDSFNRTYPALDNVLAYVPGGASLYRAWSAPSRARITSAVTQVVSGERPSDDSTNLLAPQISAAAADAIAADRFETRIDQPAPTTMQATPITGLVDKVMAMGPKALLHVQQTIESNDQVFVIPQSGLVIECERPNQREIEDSLHQVAGILRTGELDPIHVAVAGNLLLFSRIDLNASPAGVRPEAGTSYLAAFNKTGAWPHYQKLFRLIDPAPGSSEQPGAESVPTFFSGNVQSLGEVFQKLSRVTVAWQDEGARLRETLQYQEGGNP